VRHETLLLLYWYPVNLNKFIWIKN